MTALNAIGQLFNSYVTGLFIISIALPLSASIVNNRKNWLWLWGSFLFMQIVIWTIKLIINRPRPFGNHNILSPGFPSGVAADAGFVATFLSYQYPKLWILWHILGFGVALLRVQVGAHYINDVIAGYLVGVIIAGLSLRLR